MLKTYRIYRQNTSPITIDVKEKAFTPNFQQVGLFKDFSTRDKDVQEALEGDKRFKFAYFLVYTEVLEEAEEEQKAESKKKPPLTPTKGENNSTPSEGLGEAEGEVNLDITTTQAAKAFLRANGIEISNFATKEKLIEVASANGISFPNLV